MSKNAWSPGRMSRSLKTWGWGEQRSPETALMLSTCSAPIVEQELRDVRDELALADARLQLLGDQLVGAVDHRAGRVQQRDLVDRLDLAGVEHRLLAVADEDALVLERREHRRLDDVDADRHVGDALGPEDLGDLASGAGEEAGIRRDGAAQPDHPAPDVLGRQPRAVEAMVLGRRAEVPEVRLAAPRQQREAGHLVAGPLADVGARDVADVVEVEEQERADVASGERRLRSAEPVRPQPVGLTRSSQSTVWAPGEANGRVAIDEGVAASTALTESSSWVGDGGQGPGVPFTNATQPTSRRNPQRVNHG